MKTSLRFVLFFALLVAGSLLLRAQVPPLLEYDGFLSGNITGNRTMGVKLYNASKNGTELYNELIGTVKVTNGEFYFQYGQNGTLGNGTTPTGITATLPNGSEHWLAITVNGTEQSPRQRLLSVPFALRSGNSGNTVLSGTVNPVTSVGNNGDFYFNTVARTMFGPKTAGAWGNATTLVGPQGPAGAIGAQGPQGPVGPQGASGKSMLSGTVNPLSSVGNDGDFYFNTANRTMFGPKTAGAWGNATTLVGPQGAKGDTGNAGPAGPMGPSGPQGPAGPKGDNGNAGPAGPQGPAGAIGAQGPQGPTGPQGTAGKSMLSGTENPLSSVGNDGDFYFNTVNRTMFGPKTAGAWGNGTTLVGAQGAKGDPGNAGLAGPAGAMGPQGPTGPQGPAGAQGPAGPKGDAGAVGAMGPQGPQGPKGDAGSVDQSVLGALESKIQLIRNELIPAGMVNLQGGVLPSSSQLAGQGVASLLIGKYEVTWEEWKSVRDWATANGYSDLAGVGGTYPSGSSDNFPVVNVSWYDVVKWCNAKSQKEGLVPVYLAGGEVYKSGVSIPTTNAAANGYRLPSESEWEWAARGGVLTQGFKYSGSENLNDVGWYYVNSGQAGTRAVGTKNPNEFGIFDMCGNVWEWCQDISSNSNRRIRGGSWLWNGPLCEVTNRSQDEQPGNSNNNIGFRLVRSLSGAGTVEHVATDVASLKTQTASLASNITSVQEQVAALSNNAGQTLEIVNTISSNVTTQMATLEAMIKSLRDELAAAGVLSASGGEGNATATMITVQAGTLPQSSELAGQMVSTFQIGKYEVTWGEWKVVRDWAVTHGYSDLAGVGNTYPAGNADNFPVINVSWYDVCNTNIT